MTIMKCNECNNDVMPERVELGYNTCIKCAGKKPKIKGVMSYDEHMTPTIHIIPGEKYNSIKHFLDIAPEKMDTLSSEDNIDV